MSSKQSNSTQSKQRLVINVVLVLAAVLAGCARTPAQNEARFLEKGRELAAKKDFSRATLEFKNAAQAMPRDAEPYYQLGVTYISMHDARNAFVMLTRATELNPKHSGAQLALAQIQSTSTDPSILQQAKERVERVLASKPADPDALETLAVLDTRMGNVADSERNLQAALNASPQRIQSSVNLARLKLKENDAAGAEAVLKVMVQNSPQSSVAALTLADFYLRAGRKAEAESEVRRAVQLDPKNASGLLLMAALDLEAGRKDHAEQLYREVSALPDKSLKSQHAIYLYRSGRQEEGLAELNRLVTQDPGDGNSREALISAYLTRGDTKNAQRVVDNVLKHNPRDSAALLQRSGFYMTMGKPDEAERDLQTVLNIEKQSAEAHYGLAKIAAMRGSILVERQELGEALRLNPRLLGARIDLSALLRTSNAPKEALDALNQASAAERNEPAYVVERNWVLMASGDKQELRKNLDALPPDRRTADILYQDALLRVTEKDYTRARPLLEQILKQNPESLGALNMLAQTYAAQGNKAKAFETIQEYASKKPNSPPLLSMVGTWRANSGNFPEARDAFMAATAADPNYVPAHLALADVDISLGKLDEARHTLQAVLSKQPRNTQAKLRLGTVEETAGDLAAAREQYREVVQWEPRNVTALNGLAFTLAPDNPDEALKYAQSAVELAPEDPIAHDNLGWLYYRKGVYYTAVEHLKSSVAKDPNALHRYHLALAYAKLGNKQLAQENLDAALRLDPKVQASDPFPK